MKRIASVISETDDSENERQKLQSSAKLRIKKRVNNKIAEAAEEMFSESVLHPNNRDTFHKMAKCFKRFAASLKKAKRGCVLCYLDFPDVGCYDTFWRGYSDGSLSDTLTQELITDDMRAAEGGADLYIHVRVLDSATEDGDFSDQDPSGTAGRAPPPPGASREHSGQGPPASGSSNHGDDTPPGYHGDDTGGQQMSSGDDVIQVKQEPAEQVPSCCMMGTVKSEMDTLGMEVKEESSELDRQFAAIADHLGSMWERLASSLGFNTDYIRDLTARRPPSLRPHQLICDWMERNLGDVTLEQLVQALRDAGIHEVADAAASGQLFVTETNCDAAKGKADGDMDTGRADGEDSSNDRSPDDTDRDASALASNGSHGNMEGGPMSEEDENRSLNSDTDDDESGAASLPATCISTGIETNLPDDNVLLGEDTSKDCYTSETSYSRPAIGDIEDLGEPEVSAEKYTNLDHGQDDSDQPDQVQSTSKETIASTSMVAQKKQIPESSQATGTCSSCKRTMQPEYCYTCLTCENCNLCVVCYKKKGHSHEMQWGLQPSDADTLQPSLSYHEARRLSIQRCIQSLVHACQCRDANCRLPSCLKMKRVWQHTKSCKRRAEGGCPIFKQLIALYCYHGKHCQQQKCPVPFCLLLRIATMDKSLHEEKIKDAEDSGQLFVTEADLEAAQGKPDNDMDTGRPDDEVETSSLLRNDAKDGSLGSEWKGHDDKGDGSSSDDGDSDDVPMASSSVDVQEKQKLDPTKATRICTSCQQTILSEYSSTCPTSEHCDLCELCDHSQSPHTPLPSQGTPGSTTHTDKDDIAVPQPSAAREQQDSPNQSPVQARVQARVASFIEQRTQHQQMQQQPMPNPPPLQRWPGVFQGHTGQAGIQSQQQQGMLGMMQSQQVSPAALQVQQSTRNQFPAQALQQLVQVLKAPSSPQQQQQVLSILKSNPQLMAAFIKQRTQHQQMQQQQRQQGTCMQGQQVSPAALQVQQVTYTPFAVQALQKLKEVLNAPSSPQQQQQVLSILKSNPQLMEAFIKKRTLHQQMRRHMQQQQLPQVQQQMKQVMSHQLRVVNNAETQGNMPTCTFTSTLYPTGEDALAWNDCLLEFFKTDEDTATSIQESWPSNLLVKHLIRDRFFHSYLCEYWKQYQSFPDTLAAFVEFVTKMSVKHLCNENDIDEHSKSAYENICIVVGKAAFENHTNHNSIHVYKSQIEWDDIQQSGFGWLKPVVSDEAEDAFQFVHDSIRQYLMAVWVSHTVRTQTDCTELLRVCAEKSAHLPITCYSLAHLLGMAASPPTHLSQFVTLLMQKVRTLNDFDHMLLVLTMVSESNKLDALPSVIEDLFPDKTLTLSALPEISHHGLHCLAQLIRNTSLIQTIKLPENRTCFEHVSKQYPFGQKRLTGTNHRNQMRYLSYVPLFDSLSSASSGKPVFIEAICFTTTDQEINVETIQQYFQFGQSLKKLKVRSNKLKGGTLGDLSKSLLFTPNVTDVVIALKEVDSEEIEQAMVVLSWLNKLEDVEVTEYRSTATCCLSVSWGTFMLKWKTRPNTWRSALSFRPSDIREIVLDGTLSAAAVAMLVSSFPHLTHLVKLWFNCLKVGSSGWSTLLQGLASLPSTTASVGSSAAGGSPPLEVLSFSDCDLTDKEVRVLKGILKTFRNLKEVDLSHTFISNETVPGLAECLGSCQNLKKVNLSDNKLSDRGDFLPPLLNLEEIDLSVNAISDEAVPGLAEGLGSCQNLKKVDLSCNKLSDVRELTATFTNLPLLTRVDMCNNSLSDESLPAIAAWLIMKVRTGRDVERVDLFGNRFSAEGVRDFVRTMKGKAFGLLENLLYDGSLADVGEAVESGGEDVRREEQQWERLRGETFWIRVKVGQLMVFIDHKDRRSNNLQLMPL